MPVVCAVMTLGTNWAGSYAYRARELHRPATLEALQEIVARAPHIRVLGSRHTFSDIADSEALVSLEALPPDIEIADGAVSVGGAVRYGELARALAAEGLALHNLASLPHITVAGAVATATSRPRSPRSSSSRRPASSSAPGAATRTSTAWWWRSARSGR
jgi:xylitol oxidase